jgi:hypothetical protein
LIDEIVREGARRMLAEALQAEVDAYIARFADERDEKGHRMVVRNGTHAPRVLGKLEASKYPRLEVIFADNKYNNKTLDEWLQAEETPYSVKVVSKPEDEPGFVPVKIRWVVEQSIGCLNRYRRLSKDYERLNASSETWVQIAAVSRMTRRLKPHPSNGNSEFNYPKKAHKTA